MSVARVQIPPSPPISRSPASQTDAGFSLLLPAAADTYEAGDVDKEGFGLFSAIAYPVGACFAVGLFGLHLALCRRMNNGYPYILDSVCSLFYYIPESVKLILKNYRSRSSRSDLWKRDKQLGLNSLYMAACCKNRYANTTPTGAINVGAILI